MGCTQLQPQLFSLVGVTQNFQVRVCQDSNVRVTESLFVTAAGAYHDDHFSFIVLDRGLNMRQLYDVSSLVDADMLTVVTR